MVNYNIADLVSRINNSKKANKSSFIKIPLTKDNYQIITQLENLGIVQLLIDNKNKFTLNNNIKKNILINILYDNKLKLNLVSKPGKRIYFRCKDFKDFNHGHKQYLVRTSKGIISTQTAIRENLGGEVLLKITYSP